MKQLIFFALSVLTFAVSILYISQFLDIQPLVIMLALGVLIASFLHMAGLNKRDFDERKYKKLLREKNQIIKTLQIINSGNICNIPYPKNILEDLKNYPVKLFQNYYYLEEYQKFHSFKIDLQLSQLKLNEALTKQNKEFMDIFNKYQTAGEHCKKIDFSPEDITLPNDLRL